MAVVSIRPVFESVRAGHGGSLLPGPTMHARTTTLRSARAAALAAALSLLAACTQGDRLQRSLDAYDNRQFDESYRLATEAAADARTTTDQDQASYVAGMSAFQLGRFDEAAKLLEQPARSSDRWMAGQAGVTLGSAQLKLGRRSDAARSFERAAGNLEGEEARKAWLAAGNAHREAGNRSSADAAFRNANVPVPSQPAAGAGSEVRTVIGGSTGTVAPPAVTGPFVLQGGAFRDLSKAQRRVDELRGPAGRAGLGDPRVLTKRGPDGGTLYVVQLGGFATRAQADAALARLATSGVVVARPAA